MLSACRARAARCVFTRNSYPMLREYVMRDKSPVSSGGVFFLLFAFSAHEARKYAKSKSLGSVYNPRYACSSGVIAIFLRLFFFVFSGAVENR